MQLPSAVVCLLVVVHVVVYSPKLFCFIYKVCLGPSNTLNFSGLSLIIEGFLLGYRGQIPKVI